ncbi:MAG: hypothetical protein ACT4O5_10520 [Gammaproteobacteria bacterium]
MQANTSIPQSRVAAPTASYGRLIARRAEARMQLRPAVPVAVLARLLDYGAEIKDHPGAVILQFDQTTWERLARDRVEYVRTSLARYRDLYAVIGGERTGCQGGEAL